MHTSVHESVRIARSAFPSLAPSRLACEAAGILGLTLDDLARPDRAALELDLPPGSLTVLTGPSGSGKTTLRADVQRAFQDASWPDAGAVVDPGMIRPRERSCLDLLAGSSGGIEDALHWLARCGLSDASTITARTTTLSDGQNERMHLALAMRRSERLARRGRPVMLSIDELGARVDEATARSVARCLRRWLSDAAARKLDIRCVVSTHSPGALSQLRPCTRVRLSALGTARIERDDREAESVSALYEIMAGSRRDLAGLAPLHYRPGAPATIARVLRCVERSSGEVVGVLAISLPTLNARWRELAWPGRYDSGDRGRDAHRLNAELRCISRVIVEPAHRGMGIATHLVRSYLASPLTPATEALAAMGRISPVFERAGMTAQALPIPVRHQRLLDVLEAVGIEPWRLAQPSVLVARVGRLEDAKRRLVEGELSRWANASRATRRMTDADPGAILEAACRVISVRPVAYTHVRAGLSSPGSKAR